MTIYKPNGISRKQEKCLVKPPEVVISDKVPLTPDGILLAKGRVITNSEVLRRRRMIKCAFIMVTLIMLFSAAIISTLVFIRYRNSRPLYAGYCAARTQEGQFEEHVVVGEDYEKLEVPPVFNFRRSTVVHDFQRNLTAIVDRDHGRCYLMKLNRDIVKPPANFMDLLKKFKTGYYLPKADMVHEEYKVELPRLEDTIQFGETINDECQYFDTFRLVKSTGDSNIRSKRSIECSMAGDAFFFGYSGTDHMTSITLHDCVH